MTLVSPMQGKYLEIPLREAENISHFTGLDSWKEQLFIFHPFFLEIHIVDLMDFYHVAFLQIEISLQRRFRFSLLHECC